jgi:hypothetical protein
MTNEKTIRELSADELECVGGGQTSGPTVYGGEGPTASGLSGVMAGGAGPGSGQHHAPLQAL